MCSSCFHVAAQSFVCVVQDQNTNTRICDAFISIINEKEQVLSQGITDAKGNYTFELEREKNRRIVVLVKHLNYELYIDTFQQRISNTPLIINMKPRDLQLDEMVITAQSSLSSVSKSVHKVKVVTAEKISEMAAVTLNDVLVNELNIRINQDNILGSGMSMQGISGQNVKILIDGIPMVGRLNGNIDLSQINLNDVERIEIVEGPLSVNYGTNALAGTINIITKKQTAKAGFHGNAKVQFENIGNHNILAGTSYSRKNSFLSISGGRNYFDGWSPNESFFPEYKPQLANDQRFLQWKPKEQYFARANINRTQGKTYLSYGISAFDEMITNRGLPMSPYKITAFDDYYRTKRLDNSLTMKREFTKKSSLYGHIAYNYFERHKNSYLTQLTTLEKTLSTSAGSQDTAVFDLWNLRLEYNNSSKEKLTYQIGFEGNIERNIGIRIDDGQQSIADYAIYATTDIQAFKTWIVKPGLRYAYNSAYEAPLIPSLNIKKQSPNNKWIYRASYARGFRAPSVKELYFMFIDINHNIQGNDELSAEKSHNFSTSVVRTHLIKNGMWQAEIAGYANFVNEMINLALVADNQYSYVNIDQFNSMGMNMNLSYRVKKINAKIAAGFNRQEGMTGNSLVSKPTYNHQVVGNLGYNIPVINWRLNAFLTRQSSLMIFSIDAEDNLVQSSIAAYTMVDLLLSKKWLKDRFLLSIGGKNLANVQNLQITGQQVGGTHNSNTGSTALAMGRYWLCTLEYKF